MGSQLLSIEFLFILLFSMVFFTRATLYLGLLDAFLASPQFSDYSTDTQQSYLNLLSGIVPLGCLFAPVIDPLIKRLGFLCYALWVAVTGAAYTALMLVPSMHVQLLGCVFFTYYRANVFAFPGIYNITVFGGRTVGTVQGLMFTLSAPLNYLSSPALTMTQSHYHGDFVRPRRSLPPFCRPPLTRSRARAGSADLHSAGGGCAGGAARARHDVHDGGGWHDAAAGGGVKPGAARPCLAINKGLC